MPRYDAIIVGGSFAGLVTAQRIRGRVLLIDKRPIGSHQTSACGTPVEVLARLGLTDCILQVHREIVLHVGPQVSRLRLPYPFCTFDYAQLCHTLLAHAEVDVVQAAARGVQEDAVVTTAGTFHADCIVDASGWRAVLASSIKPDYVDRARLSFGLETEVPVQDEGLHFWLDRDRLPSGLGWVFPVGRASRIGVASYQGESDLGERLAAFLAPWGVQPAGYHGGFLPWAPRQPIVGPVFVVGDAAGQCLGLSGEGIRLAVYFGDHCGQIVQRVVAGELSPAAGRAAYAAFVHRHWRFLQFMASAQRALLALPGAAVSLAARLAAWAPFTAAFFAGYRNAINPGVLGAPAR